MRLREFISLLDSISPFELQEKWDNSGLQVGDLGKEVDKVYLSIDLDSDLIERLQPHSVIVTHHPLIFSKLSRLSYDEYPAKLLVKLIQKDIAHIAMHTNFDKTHLNAYVAKTILGVEPQCEEFVCTFEKEGSFAELVSWVSQRLGLRCPRVVEREGAIKNVALTTGSGGSLIGVIQADLFLTGDLKYHDAMRAKELGLGVIDIGHFESERYFADALLAQLKKHQIEAIIAPIKTPIKVWNETVH
ncbi:MAG: Nif3-like dinuclear metal center hexameric protein [Epsilonproteobacteria bacterium]|nr:Nif3-like dinuclear metal center hexameric protein [Campylobacterota bacterium]NPA64382.1 Nif3-like dinuclear metal center hexameric protein [Campylobacterota bacterium]